MGLPEGCFSFKYYVFEYNVVPLVVSVVFYITPVFYYLHLHTSYILIGTTPFNITLFCMKIHNREGSCTYDFKSIFKDFVFIVDQMFVSEPIKCIVIP